MRLIEIKQVLEPRPAKGWDHKGVILPIMKLAVEVDIVAGWSVAVTFAHRRWVRSFGYREVFHLMDPHCADKVIAAGQLAVKIQPDRLLPLIK